MLLYVRLDPWFPYASEKSAMSVSCHSKVLADDLGEPRLQKASTTC